MFRRIRNSTTRTVLAAVVTAVVLLAPTALFLAAIADRPMKWDVFALTTLLTDMYLCALLGLACMLAGFVMVAIRRDLGESLLRLGGALGLIFFTFLQLFGALWGGDSPSGPPPGGGSGS
jgi:hypothetical protein